MSVDLSFLYPLTLSFFVGRRVSYSLILKTIDFKQSREKRKLYEYSKTPQSYLRLYTYVCRSQIKPYRMCKKDERENRLLYINHLFSRKIFLVNSFPSILSFVHTLTQTRRWCTLTKEKQRKETHRGGGDPPNVNDRKTTLLNVRG